MKRLRVLLAPLMLAAACGGGTSVPVPEDLIDRETFIDVYVELRAAATETEDFAVPGVERDRILAERGLDADAVLRFADFHGPNVEFMRQVWNDVETRLAARTQGGEEEER